MIVKHIADDFLSYGDYEYAWLPTVRNEGTEIWKLKIFFFVFFCYFFIYILTRIFSSTNVSFKNAFGKNIRETTVYRELKRETTFAYGIFFSIINK